MKNKLYSLELARFGFTVLIAVFHFLSIYSRPHGGGYIGVEFFFILSGFLMMKSLDDDPSASAGRYIFKRLKRLYPHYFFSFMIVFLFRNYVARSSIKELLRNLFSHFDELLLLHGTVLTDENTFLYNSFTWYISILLVTSYVLWALLRKWRNAVVTAAPVVVIWIYTNMAYSVGHLNIWRQHIFGIANYAALRAVAGMLLGILSYQLADRLKSDREHGRLRLFAGGVC